MNLGKRADLDGRGRGGEFKRTRHPMAPIEPTPNRCRQSLAEMEEFLKQFDNYTLPRIGHVEVELRLGNIWNGYRFAPGVTEEFFQHYSEKLDANGALQRTPTTETDHSYEMLQLYNRLTVAEGEDGASTIAIMNKDKIFSPINISNRFRFDARLSASKEVPLSDNVPTNVPDGWNVRRRKERVQYDHPRWLWYIHLTKVTSVDSANAPQGGQTTGEEKVTYEIEYELKDASVLKDIQSRGRAIHEVFMHLLTLMGGVIDRLEMSLADVSPQDIHSLQERCWSAVRPNPGQQRNEGFPGSMPVSFSRRHFKNLAENEYFLSEKTDGIRYMMMILPNAIFMIGRKFDFHRLCHFDGLHEQFRRGITILDGELVETLFQTPPRLTFMVFDVIQFENEVISHRPLRDRLGYIGKAVGYYRAAYQTKKELRRNHPFDIIGKHFVTKEGFRSLHEKIFNEHGHRFYRDDKRFHRTDGFILTPNTPYHPKGCPDLYKWKYTDLLSVDFRILPEGNRLMLACAGRGENNINCREMELLPEDDEAVKKVLEARRTLMNQGPDPYYSWLQEESVILEMTFDSAVGMWRYHLERADKSRANHISVVFDTMEAVAENITEHDFTQLF